VLHRRHHLPLRFVPELQLKNVYLVGKDATLTFWAKRILPDELWTSIMQRGLS
jgi:hypothetical protein